jgi:hypothetical protein
MALISQMGRKPLLSWAQVQEAGGVDATVVRMYSEAQEDGSLKGYVVLSSGRQLALNAWMRDSWLEAMGDMDEQDVPEVDVRITADTWITGEGETRRRFMWEFV